MEPVSLQVDPVSGPIDGPTVFRAHGVAPGLPVHLDVAVVDANGHRWVSHQDYPIDADGLLQIEDPDRPWWNMMFVDEGVPPVTFAGSDEGIDFSVSIHALEGSSSTTVRRTWGDAVVRQDLAGDGWRLRIYLPDTDRAIAPGVVVVPGTTGGRPAAPTAALLASHGYVAAVLVYMDEPGLPENFAEIRLEAIADAMAAFAEHEHVDPENIAVFAASVGVSVALATLAYVPPIPVRAVTAIAPAHVVLQALADGQPPKTSSLSLGGEPLPYMPIRTEKLAGQMIRTASRRMFSRAPTSRALKLRPAYEAGLRDIAELKLPPGPDTQGHRIDGFQNYEMECERRDALKAHLAENGIGTLIQWGGMAVHHMRFLGFTQTLPRTDAFFQRCLMLPMNAQLAADDVDYVIATVRRFYGASA